ncbi:FecR family protein [Flavivirga eckloniae]|uniref:Iron dicitrate transport regulator FecR n=1 Tax=Flavivirga eckloniae TaxID=1803846 RepID=A0A2K9PLH5_9FLAO|nr:FecR domain-containing protein [Flavivirga eckloniae]AUP77929.1 hypothetical protein C1H87_04060 [Flavivirga eckloniae]
MKDVFYIARLTIKKWFGFQTEREQEALDAHQEILNSTSQKEIEENLESYNVIDLDAEWDDFENLLSVHKKTSSHRIISFKPYLKYAAIFVGLLVGSYFFIDNQDVSGIPPVIALNELTSAQITLEDGRVIRLNASERKEIRNKKSEIIAVAYNNEINYVSILNTSERQQHILTVPFGQNLKVRLADGTKIYCDAGTTITYPTHYYRDTKRNLHLIGQAYFDVAKDKDHPFIVTTKDMKIEVLGTQFNVNAYPENLNTSTVLVEGSVAIQPTKKPKASKQFLVPGQRAAIQSRSGKLKITDVNTYNATSWVSGKLVFKKTPFNTILETLSRKYNITIINKNEYLSKQLFTAKFDVETLEQILEAFKADTPFTYTKKGNTLTIN